ncbi:MAG TPA: pyruvate kinase [Planctomycetota bacterium]|nr:pyruvate kinase [Planctomycetota bacterium]
MPRFRPERLRTLLRAIDELLETIAANEETHASCIAAVPAEQRASARNLAHYLAVRTRDLRPLQGELHALALSSLGRMEGYVRATLRGVQHVLHALLGGTREATAADADDGLGVDEGERRLQQHTERLLGPRPQGRAAHVMVTLPAEAATDPDLLRSLLQAGMDVARVNLAHNDAATWTQMIANLRRVAGELGRVCRVLVDLPGPKLRTGALPPGPRVCRVQPKRDEFGRCTTAASVVFHDAGIAPPAERTDAACVPLQEPLAHRARCGDVLVVEDARPRTRPFVVVASGEGWCRAATERTAYLGTGNAITLRRGVAELGAARIGGLPALAAHIALRTGDVLVVTREGVEAAVAAPSIPCAQPRVFEDVRAGHRILFDDGKIAGTVLANDGERLQVRITGTPPGGGKLRAEKGINLPDTELHASALTPADRERLDWAAQHADMIGLSFAQRPADVLQLQEELRARGRADLGIVLKIETAIGFQRLPALLFAGLRHPPLGVMVARGDLAVEVGYERLAEVQEEILWLCEAAHLPVIWATQVLDSMARTGVPSRAEVTDAAMGGRAECVMLNKGPYVADAVRFLAGLLVRMQDHAVKKLSLLRRLRIAGAQPVLASGRSFASP